MATHTTYLLRDGPVDAHGDPTEIEIIVEFTLSGGHPGTPASLSYPGDPPEPPEMEITGAWNGEVKVELTDDESQRVERDVFDRLEDFDDGYNYEE